VLQYRILFVAFLVALIFLGSDRGYAITLETPLADSQQEARAQTFFYQIRCLVCQGESIADSRATLATDLRRFIRDAIEEGQSDEQILASLRNAYGDEIFMQPPVQSNTLVLWLGPFLLLLFSGLFVWHLVFSKR
jgi:cytochrome c-type biogenesis protein CcmH